MVIPFGASTGRASSIPSLPWSLVGSWEIDDGHPKHGIRESPIAAEEVPKHGETNDF